MMSTPKPLHDTSADRSTKVCTGTLLSCAQMHGIISPIGHLLTQYRSAIYRCTQFILLSLIISQ